MIGFIMVGFTEKKQGLHDMMAGTLVVKEKPAKTGLVLLSIFGPTIIGFISVLIFSSMIFSILGFGLGSIFSRDTICCGQPYMDPTLEEDESEENKDIVPTTEAEYDDLFDKESLSHLVDSLDMGNELRAEVGPGVIEMKSFFDSKVEYDRIGFYLPSAIPNVEYGKVDIKISNLYSKSGEDVFDRDSSFEKNDFFTNLSMQSKHAGGDDTYYYGYRSVHYLDGNKLTDQTFDRALGTVTIKLPTSDGKEYVKSYPFEIKVERGEYDEFAMCLSQSGAKFYGASWCSHCADQKEMFGKSKKYLPYIECSLDDESGNQANICEQAKITGYPTWVFKDGTRLEGVKNLEDLAKKTQCSLPI